MTDLATLGLIVDSTQVKDGVDELNNLTVAGARAEQAVKKLGNEATQAGGKFKFASTYALDLMMKTQMSASEMSRLTGSLGTAGGAAVQTATSVRALGVAFQLIGGLLGGVVIGAVTALVAVLGHAVAKHFQAESAVDAHRKAMEELETATNALHDATVKEMRSTQESIRVDIVKANSLRQRATEARRAAVAELELAKSRLEAGKAGAQSGEPGSEGISLVLPSLERDTNRIQAEINRQNALIGKQDETIRLKRGAQIQQELAEKYDGVAAAAGKYERRQDALNGMLRIGIINERLYRAELDKAIGTREREEKAARDALKKPPKPRKEREDHSAERLAERLAREAAASNATTAALFALADAYLASDAAGLKAEARANAAGRAIKAQGDIEAFVAREMKQLVAQRAVDGAKLAAGLNAQTGSLKELNDAVSAGITPASQAATVLQNEAQLRPLIVAQAIAEGAAKDELAKIIARLRSEQAAANAEANRAQVLASTASAQDQLDRLRQEATLIGATNVERTKAIALLQAEQFLKANPGASAAEAQAYLDTQVGIAVQTVNNATAQDNYNSSLSYTRDLLAEIGNQAGTLGGILSSAFGGFGDSIGGLITALTDLQTQQQAISDWKRDEIKKAGGDATRLAQIEVLAAKQSQTAQMKATAQAISGVKSLFKEKSTAFKVMSAIEKAYAVWQAAETIASMVRDTTKTVSAIANSTARATAAGTEGVAHQSKLPFPYNIVAMAATAAALIAAGIAVFGGGGGAGAGYTGPTAEDIQEQAGTGSVLGDAKAKSESIAHSLELVAQNTNKDLEYSNAMLAALRNIDTSIAKMAGTVAKQIQVAGSLFDTSRLKLGSSGSNGFLGLIGGKTQTRELLDLGIKLLPTTVANIIAKGIEGFSYQKVLVTTKKSGFLGIGGGTSTSTDTTKSALGSDIENAIQQVVLSLRDGLLSAADVIGLQGAEAILNSFNVNIGKISFKDMTGAEIEDQLNAIFSKVGDDMAGAIFPQLKAMQLIGEGLFETFMRVAREYEVVDIALRSIGRSFGAVGVGSVAARDALVQLFGGLDEFVESTSFFRDQFLSNAEQIAPIAASVRAELTRLGVAGITTRDQFKNAVLGLDLTTTAGREMYAALLQVAPAFDKVMDYFDELNKKTIDGLQSTIDKFTSFAESLKKYRDTLFQTDAAQGNAYAMLRQKFLATAGLAAQGDATALGGLESAGKAFLDAAKNNASTREQYLRDVAVVAQGVDKGIFAAEATADYAQLQLDALKNATSILQQISQNTASTAAALTQPAVVTQPAGTAPTNSQSFPTGDSATQQQNETIIQQNAQIIAALSDMRRVWTRWDGDGLLIRTDEDTPIQVETVA